MSKLYNVGIYCRLSVDDASNTQKHNYIDGDESGSIENQRQMLSQFVLLQGWIETKVYCDDGYSGGHFHRPGFQQMIEDAKKGVIDLILCKDLSRLGRDYIEVGRYTDVLFPTWKCRFIALLDEIDTANDDNDMLHFRSLMNDYHLKDLSNKIKTVFSAKAMKSGYLTGRPPYGYVREESKSHLLIPDLQAAEVIRRIFAMRADGASYSTIARTLNTDGVMTANDYWAVRNGKTIKKPSLWYIQVVKNILRCEMYNGTLINNKKPSLSYKAGEKRLSANGYATKTLMSRSLTAKHGKRCRRLNAPRLKKERHRQNASPPFSEASCFVWNVAHLCRRRQWDIPKTAFGNGRVLHIAATVT